MGKILFRDKKKLIKLLCNMRKPLSIEEMTIKQKLKCIK